MDVIAKFNEFDKEQSECDDTDDSCPSKYNSPNSTDQSSNNSITDDQQSKIENASYQYDQSTNIDFENSEASKRPSLGSPSLPCDVQRMIYRDLLQTSEPIDSVNGGLSFAEYTPDGKGARSPPSDFGRVPLDSLRMSKTSVLRKSLSGLGMKIPRYCVWIAQMMR